MRRTFISIFILWISISSFVFAGGTIDKFSNNKEEFLTQMQGFMTASKSAKLKLVYKSFEHKVRANHFSEDEFGSIVDICNIMQSRKMAVSPYFENYLKAITQIKEVKYAESKTIEWHGTLEAILKNTTGKKFKPYKDFLVFCNVLFTKNALYASKTGVSWLVKTADCTFKYEDKMPCVVFESLDLTATRKGKSIEIKETSGCFFPLTNEWKGKGGIVSWEKLGETKDVYGELTNYTVEVKKGMYKASQAKMHHPQLLPKGPINGQIVDKIILSNKKAATEYPRFVSDIDQVNIDDIGAGIHYRGGFKLHGTSFYGVADKNEKAEVKIFNEQRKIIFKSKSKEFIIRKSEKVASQSAEVVVYIGQDSIYHPSVQFKMDIENKVLSLIKGDVGKDRNPFFSSLHKIDIDVNRIDWNIETDSIYLGKKVHSFVGNNNRMMMQSVNFYNEAHYAKLQNMADVNPIANLKLLSDEHKSLEIEALTFAKKMHPNFDVSSIKSLLYDLMAEGFIVYDKETEFISIRPKLIHYADASQERVDYDQLKMVSDTDKANGILNIKDGSMITNGVKKIEFNQEHQIAAMPLDKTVLIKQNRDMDFDGKLFAGYGVFEGKGLSFNYNRNEVEMDSVRFFDLYLESEGDKAKALSSRIEYTSGILLIDAPSNKSGEENLKVFPSYNSKADSYIFYDDKKTQNGCYSRDSFSFQLDPFSLNGMDEFAQEDLEFKGTLKSAGIFPDIKETLILQEDQSLGFTKQITGEGLGVYKRGNYNGELNLSNKGLLGKGQLSYLWATIDSEDFIFRPDQTVSTAKVFELKEDRTGDIQVPQVIGNEVFINWMPYKDSMYVVSKERSFQLFKKDNYWLDGLMILTPGGLKGRGDFNWEQGKMTSDLFSFGAFSTEADTTDLQIKALEMEALAFDTKNVKAKIDFDALIGRFKANDADANTKMPQNKYITSMNEFEWDMKTQAITFLSDENSLGHFQSIDKKQDSLAFDGKSATYDMKTSALKIGGVPSIEVADALIHPLEGNVNILSDGKMEQLNDAKIVANTKSKYHVINKANITVESKRRYTASGYYEYNIGDRQQEIKFSNIIGEPTGKGKKSERPLLTQADGEVSRTANFYIDHKTRFSGKISLKSDRENLHFDGFAQFDSPYLSKDNWFKINSIADKNNLILSYNEPMSYDGTPVRTGLFLDRNYATIYSSVMTPLNSRKDRTFFETQGVFKYDQKTDQFILGDSLKVSFGHNKGNQLTMSNKDGVVKAEGSFELGNGLKYISLTTAGYAESNMQQSEMTTDSMTTAPLQLELMAGIDLLLPSKLMDIVLLDISSSSFDAGNIPFLRNNLYQAAIPELVADSKLIPGLLTELKTNRRLNFPKKHNPFNFLFTDVEMKWNSEYQSFLSKGSKLGLVAVKDQLINKMLESYIEVRMPSNGDDRLYLYIESPSGNYYYFGFKQGILNTVSNNPKYNEAVIKLGKKEQSRKMKDGETFEIQPVNPGTANQFINRIKSGQK